MALDPQLVALLVCPQDKEPLLYVEAESCLYNPRLRRRYPIQDDIPVLLVDEAEAVEDDGVHERLVAAGVPTGTADD